MYEAVINWVKYNLENRESVLPRLLENVRMPLLTARFITDVVDNEVRG